MVAMPIRNGVVRITDRARNERCNVFGLSGHMKYCFCIVVAMCDIVHDVDNNKKFRSFKSIENIHKKGRRWAIPRFRL